MRKLATWLLVAAGVFVFGNALADLTVKDGGGTTRTIKNFVCETTKLCNATVLIASDGTEISPATSAQAGSLTETAPASDTASSGLNGRLQRVSQRITSLIALLPTSLGAGGGLKVDGSGTALPVSGTVTANLGTLNGAATAANQSTGNTSVGNIDTTLGAKTDNKSTATDTTSVSGISIWKQISASIQAAATSLASIDTKASQALPAQANTTTNIGMVNVQAAANGGATPQSAISVNNTTAVVVKAGAGTLYGAQLGNIGTVPLYLKIYNATSATCGSGTPVKRLIIPKASTAADGGGSNITFGPTGIDFSTGITYCLTADIGDSGTTAPDANVALINLDHK